MDDAAQIESPCISVCEIKPETGLCSGCWRTREEIAIWARADKVLRLEILERLHERRAAEEGTFRRTNARRKKAS